MKKINLSITGCMGRMGQQLIKTSKKDKKIKIHSLTEETISKRIHNIKPQLNSENAFKNTDVIIDFTSSKMCTFEVLKIASKLKKE